ncbi:MAG: hypothetical protein GOVbin1773_14 [Prokaryotic dsDNA virus sp.]|nr:MAG: hypothetical protein GOVbin1773_14 [Prokaryotic dsDNA virus sp.]
MPNKIIQELNTAADSITELGIDPTAAEVVDRAIEFGTIAPVVSDADAARLCRIAEYLLEARRAF